LENDVVSLVTGRIHQAYTVACDELLLRGYLMNDERKAIGGLMGDLLGVFQKGIDPGIGGRLVSPADVDAMAALKEHAEKETEVTVAEEQTGYMAELKGVMGTLVRDLKHVLGFKQDSLEAKMSEIHQAFYTQFPDAGYGDHPGKYLVETYKDYVVCATGDAYHKVPYSVDGEGRIVFSNRMDWVPVKQENKWVEKAAEYKEMALKAGARHNAGDRAALTLIHDKAVELGADCPMVVTKGDDGKYRWTLTSSNAFQDRDREIVSEKAHVADIEVLEGAGEYGPLRWWHVGQPSPEVPGDWRSYKAGPGLDLGQCDFAAMHGRIRIESGTFYDDGVGAAFKEVMDKLSVSQGFSHPLDEPNRDGTFDNIHTFERSLLPRGRQSNSLASVGMILKEGNMDAKKKEALVALIGSELVEKQLSQAESTQKDAEEAGLRFKADSKIGEWTTAELKDYIQKFMEGPMADVKALFTKADAKTPEEMEAMRKKKEAGEALDATVKATGETVTQIADAVNSQADAFKLLSQTIIAQGKRLEEQDLALKSLTGDLPAGVVNGRLGYRPTQDNANVVSLKDAPPERGNEDFFSWAVRGPGNGSAVGGTPPAPAVPAI
jgi:hypothetical protein